MRRMAKEEQSMLRNGILSFDASSCSGENLLPPKPKICLSSSDGERINALPKKRSSCFMYRTVKGFVVKSLLAQGQFFASLSSCALFSKMSTSSSSCTACAIAGEIAPFLLAEPVLLYMSDISAELTMEYVVECDSSVPREPPALVSMEDESKAYGIPKKGSNGTMTVNMWPTPWTPDGWTMNIPNSETIKLGRTDQEIRNCVGKGIGGELLMGFPMPPYDSGNEEIDQSNCNEARRLIGHYRAFHEKCCLSVLLKLDCGKCEKPEERKYGYFESKAILEGANADMLFTSVLFDLACAGTKGKGMGYAAMQNQNASRSLKMAREMTGDRHLIISGDLLGATGGMRLAMNLRFLAWQKFGGRSIPEGELYKLAVDYDKKKGTNTRHSAPAVTNWAKARAATGETTYKGALKEHDDIYVGINLKK